MALQGASAAPDFVTRATAALDALAAYVGSVRLDANVDNVTFTVDGLAAKDGLLRLNSGAHTITAQKPNYTSASQRIDIVAGETRSLHFDLTPMDTNVTTTIQCETSRACSLQVDGVVLGPAPARLAREPGSYRVRATVEGKPFGEKQLDLAVGAPTTVLIRAQQLPRLHVRTEHADESVTIDGVLVGQGSLETELFAGEHTVTVTSSKGQRRSIELVLRERESRDVFLALRDSEREPSVDKSGLSPWWFIGGSAVLLGAAATAVYFALAPTRYEGSGAGSLNPYVVTATHPGGWYRW